MAGISNLEITVTTGGDDLRGDDSVTAYLLVTHGHEAVI
jgi:hypothetical protein